ncbi:MAG: adenylate/guanylate cyclase domain-containing protein [Acidobacteriota bacterium]
MAEALIKVQPLQDVLEMVMNLVFEHIHAERGFLMLYREETKKLEPVVVKYRDTNEVQPEITISKTIADRVYKDRVSILTSDAQVDPRFTGGESIRFLGIRSAMCAPLWSEDKVIGIIHVDSAMKTATFTEGDLGLLTALSNYAAVGIERARLNAAVESERALRNRLERYHSPNVVKRILEGTSSAEGEDDAKEMEITVLFSDVVGFTPLSETLAPAEVAKLLNTYFTIMADVIFKYEGTLDKFIGDAIMAVFGAPFHQEDHAERAIKVALEMLEELRIFNQSRTDAVKLEVRTGINSGRAVVGNIGSASRVDFTVLGDAVNVASRIESSVARPNTIMIGEATAQLAKNRFRLQDLGPKQLKGLKKQISVYEVLGLLTPESVGTTVRA